MGRKKPKAKKWREVIRADFGPLRLLCRACGNVVRLKADVVAMANADKRLLTCRRAGCGAILHSTAQRP